MSKLNVTNFRLLEAEKRELYIHFILFLDWKQGWPLATRNSWVGREESSDVIRVEKNQISPTLFAKWDMKIYWPLREKSKG